MTAEVTPSEGGPDGRCGEEGAGHTVILFENYMGSPSRKDKEPLTFGM